MTCSKALFIEAMVTCSLGISCCVDAEDDCDMGVEDRGDMPEEGETRLRTV